jgi:hypothetical protein
LPNRFRNKGRGFRFCNLRRHHGGILKNQNPACAV